MIIASDKLVATDPSNPRYFLFFDYYLNTDYSVLELTDNIAALPPFPYSNLQVSSFSWKVEPIYGYTPA